MYYTNHPDVQILRLKVADACHLHVELSGSPDGVPVIHLHGGPGLAWPPIVRSFFDPKVFRLVAFDQRNAWRSGEMNDWTTGDTIDDLIADLEALRCELDIPKWVLFGGSWGATLGLVYAQRFPDRCLGLVLWGCHIGDCRLLEESFSASRLHFPEVWEEVQALLPYDERHEPLTGFEKRINDDDPAVHEPFVKAWAKLMHTLGNLHQVPPELTAFTPPWTCVLNGIRTGMRYYRAGYYLRPGQLLAEAHRLAGVPGTLIHGRGDFLSPIVGSYQLHRAWPGSTFHPIKAAGHAAFEPGIAAVIRASLADLAAAWAPKAIADRTRSAETA